MHAISFGSRYLPKSENKHYFCSAFRVFSFLVVGYREDWWFWETLVMMRKLAIVVVSVYIAHGTLQTYAAAWVLTAALAAHSWAQPYVWPSITRLEQISLATLVVTLNAMLLFEYRDQSAVDDSGTSGSTGLSDVVFIALLIFIAAVNAIFVVILLYWLLWAFKQKVDSMYLSINKVLRLLHLPQIQETERLRELVKVRDLVHPAACAPICQNMP